VSERTSEIGLRLAVGARPRDIRQQFLLEAVVICTAGGVFGVLGGSAAAWVIANSFDWPILIQLWIVAIAVALASAVGVFFGYYPARRASAFSPL
jgi:putative ABC transport system permease protein